MSEPIARTVKDFCRTYATSKSEAYRLLKAGRLTGVKMGVRTKITEESALAWFKSLPRSHSVLTSLPTSKIGIEGDAAGRRGKR